MTSSRDGRPVVDPDPEGSIEACLEEISLLFRLYFDQNWLILLLERYPVDPVAMNEIRELTRHGGDFVEAGKIEARLALLEGYIHHLRRCLLPGLREKLGISGLLPAARRVWEREQLLLRRFVAYTFPFNLERLAGLAQRLKSALRGSDPAAPL